MDLITPTPETAPVFFTLAKTAIIHADARHASRISEVELLGLTERGINLRVAVEPKDAPVAVVSTKAESAIERLQRAGKMPKPAYKWVEVEAVFELRESGDVRVKLGTASADGHSDLLTTVIYTEAL